MNLIGHMVDTMKEWELKLGRIDSDIRLYYPPESIREFLNLKDTDTETEVLHETEQYLKEEAAFLGKVKVETAKDHRIGIVIPKEGCDYVADHIETPVFLKELLLALKKQDLNVIKTYFQEYAAAHGGSVLEDVEEDGIGCVLYFDREEIDPYVYCFDADDFGVTYHRFSRSDYEHL